MPAGAHTPILAVFLVSYTTLARRLQLIFLLMLASLARRAPAVHRITSRTMPTIPGTICSVSLIRIFEFGSGGLVHALPCPRCARVTCGCGRAVRDELKLLTTDAQVPTSLSTRSPASGVANTLRTRPAAPPTPRRSKRPKSCSSRTSRRSRRFRTRR